MSTTHLSPSSLSGFEISLESSCGRALLRNDFLWGLMAAVFFLNTGWLVMWQFSEDLALRYSSCDKVPL